MAAKELQISPFMATKTSALMATILMFTLGLPSMARAAETSTTLQQVTVTATREEQPKAETPATIGIISEQEVHELKAAHPGALIDRIPGVHLNVTNGEGHMTSIRQPISTDAVYLYLEDGVPTRSTGFFNHNALYEINLPQAGGVEVTKGPGSALQGSDALGAVINVLTRMPSLDPTAELSIEHGSFGRYRFLGSASNTWGDDSLRLDLNYTRTDNWRQAQEFERQSGTVRWDHFTANGGYLKTIVTAANIDQQTAGVSPLGQDDFHNAPKKNLTPISFRKVKSFRASTAYEQENGNALLSITPYVRWNQMRMLPNWRLFFDPTTNLRSHQSAGLMTKYRLDFKPMRTRVVAGVGLDYSPGLFRENAIAPTKTGAVFTTFTEGARIYDYDATFTSISPFIHGEFSPTHKLRISLGGRLDFMHYDYENNLSVTTVGTHKRAASDTVSFRHFSPKVGATYAFSPNFNGFASYKNGFRAPSSGTLFRSGNSDDTLNLNPITVDSFEVGVRGKASALDYELSVFYMRKEDDILTFNGGTATETKANAGETLHRGAELGLGYALSKQWRADLSYSYTKHTAEDWRSSPTTNFSGKELQQAPRSLGNARISYRPSYLANAKAELEWVHVGRYYTDDANLNRYKGHDLLNLRASYQLPPRTLGLGETLKIFGGIDNLLDRRYATLASFNRFRGQEQAPGLPRNFNVGIEAVF